MILKGQPKSDWPELRLKTVGQELLRGQRPEWGFRRKWEGNYLSLVSLKFVIDVMFISCFLFDVLFDKHVFYLIFEMVYFCF